MKQALNDAIADGFITTHGCEAGVELAKQLYAAKVWLTKEYGDIDEKVFAVYNLLHGFISQLEDRDWGVAVNPDSGSISFYPPNK